MRPRAGPWTPRVPNTGDLRGRRRPGPCTKKILSNLVRPYERPVMNNVRRAEYVLCLVVELLRPDWTPPLDERLRLDALGP